MTETDRQMERVTRSGRRLAAAERERAAALGELTAACAALPEAPLEDLARASGLPASAILAIRARLDVQPGDGAGPGPAVAELDGGLDAGVELDGDLAD